MVAGFGASHRGDVNAGLELEPWRGQRLYTVV